MPNKKKYIDAERAKAELFKQSAVIETEDGEIHILEFADALTAIDNVPTADVAEVKHVEWKNVNEIEDIYAPDLQTTLSGITKQTCSICRVQSSFCRLKLYLDDDYCPNCSAKMGGENNS